MKARESDLNRYFEPWLGATVLARHSLPIYIWPKEQGHGKKFKSQSYENMIRKMVCEADEQRANDGKRLGLRIVFLGPFRGDQTNCLKSIEDALEDAAYGNDKYIDYHQVVRHATRPKGDELILVEILEEPESCTIPEPLPTQGLLSSTF